MPKREDPEVKQGGTRKPEPRAGLTKIEKLTLLAGQYIAIGKEAKALTTKQDGAKKEIKEIMTDSSIYEVNGKHKEVTLPAGDGKTEYFIQVQVAETVTTVDNIVGLIRDKLKKADADKFITTVEVLTPNALESAYNQGLITEKDIIDWTTTKEVERLIVKVK